MAAGLANKSSSESSDPNSPFGGTRLSGFTGCVNRAGAGGLRIKSSSSVDENNLDFFPSNICDLALISGEVPRWARVIDPCLGSTVTSRVSQYFYSLIGLGFRIN